MMIRVKIRYGEQQKVLSFETSIEFSLLLRKIVNKLGIPYSSDDDLGTLLKLSIEGSWEVDDVNDIKDGDILFVEKKELLSDHSNSHESSAPAAPVKSENSINNPVVKKETPANNNGDDDDTDDDILSVRSGNNNDKSCEDHEVISISSDGSSCSDDDECGIDDYESSSSSEEEDEYTEVESNNYTAQCNSRKRKRNSTPKKKPSESPIEVIMEAKDIPSAPGKPDDPQEGSNDSNETMEEQQMLVNNDEKKKSSSEQDIKHRIIKLLNTGFHENSNEHEAKNAMKLAQRLMRKHNLSQALLLQEREANKDNNGVGTGDEDEVLKGGLVRVKIVNRKTRKASVFARWISGLAHPVCDNFGVKCYTSSRRGVRCDVVFYGIYANAQLAGYAFKVATEKIAQMMAQYQPSKKRSTMSTKSSRLSYAIGIVEGISEDVEKNLQMEKEKRKRKLERARLATSRGEAYEESDNEDNGDYDLDDGGGGISVVTTTEHVGSNDSIAQMPPSPTTSSNNNHMGFSSDAAIKPEPQQSISGADLDHRVQELEREEQAALVLVDHSKKIAEEVLKDQGIKLSSARRRKAINFDHQSFKQGVEDSKEIDINQRAIRDEVRVKTEKS